TSDDAGSTKQRIRRIRRFTPKALQSSQAHTNLRAAARAETIGTVLKSIASILIYGVAVFTVLAEVGINLAPLIAGAGVVGVALPVSLLVGDWWFVDGKPTTRGSLSAYYHSGMRDVFVASLAVIGLFLLTYMAFHYNWDNVLSMVGGLSAIGVAMFPTDGGEVLTPLQRELGETVVAAIHYTCAGVFILSLAAISWRFGTREHARPDRTEDQQQRWWLYHRVCASTVVAAVVFIVVTQATGVWDSYSILIGEAVAALAFGLSWFVKGAELDVLLGERRAPTPAAGPVQP
ncbi:MAG: hypothetical protein KY432_04900, partial [Acidobacteria bacterium]|nr:hypothetical protein [Acidobacteriota bacterium]